MSSLTNYSFVICNDGYTIERCIHGWDAVYNDIQPWKFSDLVPAFGAKPNKFKTYSVKTEKELTDLFADKSFAEAKVLQVSFIDPSSLYCISSFCPHSLSTFGTLPFAILRKEENKRINNFFQNNNSLSSYICPKRTHQPRSD